MRLGTFKVNADAYETYLDSYPSPSRHFASLEIRERCKMQFKYLMSHLCCHREKIIPFKREERMKEVSFIAICAFLLPFVVGEAAGSKFFTRSSCYQRSFVYKMWIRHKANNFTLQHLNAGNVLFSLAGLSSRQPSEWKKLFWLLKCWLLIHVWNIFCCCSY